MNNAGAVEPSAEDFAAIRARVKKAGTSFYYAMRILPPARRRAIFAVYAFCRVVDDIADGDSVVPDRQAALQDWHARIDRLLDGAEAPGDALDRTLLWASRAFQLRREDFHAVIDGMQRDAGAPIVAPDWAALDLYCDQVASAVGRLCVCIFGEPGPEGRAVADHLGRALQLTNILRDVEEDAERGRLYLPREALTAAGIHDCDPARVAGHPLLPTVRAAVAEHADLHFTQARRALDACDRRKMRPAIIMMQVYRRVYRKMAMKRWRERPWVFSDSRLAKIRSKVKKILIALRHAVAPTY